MTLTHAGKQRYLYWPINLFLAKYAGEEKARKCQEKGTARTSSKGLLADSRASTEQNKGNTRRCIGQNKLKRANEVAPMTCWGQEETCKGTCKPIINHFVIGYIVLLSSLLHEMSSEVLRTTLYGRGIRVFNLPYKKSTMFCNADVYHNSHPIVIL